MHSTAQTRVGTCQEVGEIKHTDALEKLSSHDKSSCGAILSRQNHFSRSGGGRPPKHTRFASGSLIYDSMITKYDEIVKCQETTLIDAVFA